MEGREGALKEGPYFLYKLHSRRLFFLLWDRCWQKFVPKAVVGRMLRIVLVDGSARSGEGEDAKKTQDLETQHGGKNSTSLVIMDDSKT